MLNWNIMLFQNRKEKLLKTLQETIQTYTKGGQVFQIKAQLFENMSEKGQVFS